MVSLCHPHKKPRRHRDAPRHTQQAYLPCVTGAFSRPRLASAAGRFSCSRRRSHTERLQHRGIGVSPGASPGDAQKALLTNETFMALYAGLQLGLPLSSVSTCVRLLEEVILPDLGRENITLIPLGPKPHALTSMLLSRIHARHVSCLRVSGTRVPLVDVKATGKLVATRVTFGPHPAH